MRNAVSINPLSQVGTEEAAGIGASIYKEHRIGNLSYEDYLVANAMMVADNPRLYPPTIPVPMPGQVSEYVRGRLFGKREPSDSSGLGAWVNSAVKARDENEACVSLFRWSIELLESKGLSDKAAKLRLVVERFGRIGFPSNAFDEACRVQRMDSDARERTTVGKR